MVMTCPNCHQLVKSTDGFCESCGFKIDTSGSSSPTPSPPPSPAPSSPVSAASIKKVCKNEKCTNYNAEYGIDEHFCGVCGSKLALEGQEEKPADLQKRGFLVMPDRSQIEITMTQTPIGRIQLSKYISEGD